MTLCLHLRVWFAYLMGYLLVSFAQLPEEPLYGSCCPSFRQQYEAVKLLTSLESKQADLEELTAAQKTTLEAQQNVIKELKETVKGLEERQADVFRYQDVIAQSSCTALFSGTDYVYAVRRMCSNQAASCEELCKSVGKTCFNALHVYVGTRLDSQTTGQVGLGTYKYNSCSGNFCGPNFCCCHGK